MVTEPQPTRTQSTPNSCWLWFTGIGFGIIGGGLVAAALLPGLLSLLWFHAAMSETDLILSEASPDGAYHLEVESQAGWVYSPHSISVFQKDFRGQRHRILGTPLYNDGANLRESNVRLSWQSNRQALLRFEGEDQEPACHLLTLGQSPQTTAVPCPALGDETP